MGEGKWPFRALGTGDDNSHLLRLLDDGEELINIDPAYRSQELKAETTPDHCGRSQGPLFVLVEALESAADDQPHIFRNIGFVDRYIRAKFAGRIEDLPLFDQMPVQLLDEERIALTLLEDGAHQPFRNLPSAEPIQHQRDVVF